MNGEFTNKRRTVGVRGAWALTWAVALLLAATVVWAAGTSTEYQKQFEHWSQTISELGRHGQSAKTSNDIELMRTWLGQGQALLANEKFEQIDPLLVRIGALAEYVEARHARLDADEAAQRAEQQAKQSEDRAEAAQRAADAAATKMTQLEKRGL